MSELAIDRYHKESNYKIFIQVLNSLKDLGELEVNLVTLISLLLLNVEVFRYYAIST